MTSGRADLAYGADQVADLRAAKDVHRRYAHLGLLGRWEDVLELFTEDATVHLDDVEIAGGPRILAWLQSQPGAAAQEGAFRAEFIDEPIAHLSADGASAQIRWSSLALSAEGDGRTGIAGGIYENVYRRTDSGWRIADQRFHTQFRGDHASGWTNVGGADLPLFPFHFSPDEAGSPLPPAPENAPPPSERASPRLAAMLAALADEIDVRNLVHALGYYVDRRMWTDVADLFTGDARVELVPGGSYRGHDGVRAAMTTMGPEGLDTGQLNDRPLFDTLVSILPDGRATTRSLELGMLGDAVVGEGAWEIRVVTTRCIRSEGAWRIEEARFDRLLHADYFRGWGTADLGLLAAPDADDPLTLGGRPTASDRELPTADLRRLLDRARAYDGVENVSSAYGYYIDDFQWPQMAALFAANGNKQSPFAGYYLGRDRITTAATRFWGAPPQTRPGISYHWRTQPVISISDDGRSATFRVRLFQPRTHRHPSRAGEFYAAGFHSGMYPNDQAVLEDGVWRLWSLTIDEPYFESWDWANGWARIPVRDPEDAPRPSRLMELYPPDIPMSALGRRAEHFRGGTGRVRVWPEILPMWFHYRNPVSGRVPEHYWPDGALREVAPEAGLSAHGYQVPPDGPR